MKQLHFISKGDERSVKAKKNILVSVFFKGGDTLIYLLLVPVTLGYLNPYEYGIWLTLNSILAWINTFDIGLGNGLRNKLAEALAKKDEELAKKYVSTTLYMLIFLAIVLSTIGTISINLINWDKLLNITPGTVHNLTSIINVSFCFFCLNFVLKFVGNVYQALQLPSVMYIMNFVGHLLSLIAIYILTLTFPNSLFAVAVVYSAAPPLVYAIVYPITFKRLFKYLAPTYSYFDIRYIKELLNLSVVFFLIQIASLILFSLSNLLISNMFGPAEVTPYNIVQRYFSVIPMITNIVIAPMWSATTDAYTKGDLKWIKSTYIKMLKLLCIVFLVLTLMVIFSPYAYFLWIGNEVQIPLVLSLLMAIYNFIIMWSHIYGYMLNGMGKLRLQALNTIAVAICFYPICHTLGSRYYVAGIILGMCLVNLSGLIINAIQFHLILSQKAHGIWNK